MIPLAKTQAHPGLLCSGWKWPADFSSALNPALSLVRTLSTTPCAGSRAGLSRPRLSQPGPHPSPRPCTLMVLGRCFHCRRLILSRLHTDQARARPCQVPDDLRLLVSPASQTLRASLLLLRVCVLGCPALSWLQPSQTSVAMQSLCSAAHANMPKSPSKRERERSRPGRLNRAFTERSPEDLPESDTPKAHVAREVKSPMSQQERRWRRTPPPFTVSSEVYYCGTLPQPSPVLDRILQDLLDQQEVSPAVTKRPRTTLKSRDTSRRLAKAEIISKRLEDKVDRPLRPRSLPPRPSLPSRNSGQADAHRTSWWTHPDGQVKV